MLNQELYNKELLEPLDETFNELLQLFSSLTEVQITTVPFEGSWTAAQLASHITKSNRGIGDALEMKGQPLDRDPGKVAEKLRTIFLDFTVKYKSPEFILPTKKTYQKHEVIEHLATSFKRLKELRNQVNLSEMINVPVFGDTTKLELLYFVLYHTQRHLHQLKNIVKALGTNLHYEHDDKQQQKK